MKHIVCILLASFALLMSGMDAWAKTDQEDEQPPELIRLELDRDTVPAGGKIIVSADAWDESAIKAFTAKFQKEGGREVLAVNLALNSREEIDLPYSGRLDIPPEAEGVYSLVSVTMRDEEDNTIRYTIQGENVIPTACKASFSVRPEGQYAPKLLDCGIQRQAGGSWMVKVDVGGLGGPINKVSALFENHENNHKLLLTMDEEQKLEEGSYQGMLELPEKEQSGTFRLVRIEVKEKDGRKTTWSKRDDEDALDLEIDLSFDHQAGLVDQNPPQLFSVELGGGKAREEETWYPLTVRAEDDSSGIRHITVKFKNAQDGSTVSKVLRESDQTAEGCYQGMLVLDEEDTEGVYHLDSVAIMDQAGNRMTWCREEDLNDRKELLPQSIIFTYVYHK